MEQDQLKKKVGEAAAERVQDGMVLGLGTGSTAEAFLDALGVRVRDGLDIVGVPTSLRTQHRCEKLGIPWSDLDTHPVLDLVIDGADEIGPDLALIKGGGGALLREKIVAAAGRSMLVIADQTKRVGVLGAYPLPIEIVPFGASATILAIEATLRKHALPADIRLRHRDATQTSEKAIYLTDGHHWIVDCHCAAIPDPAGLNADLKAIVGVVETGLFLGLADHALIAADTAVEQITRG